MADFTVDECMTDGCATALVPTPGVFYCATCVAEQLREEAATAVAFDEYHAWADSIARGR